MSYRYQRNRRGYDWDAKSILKEAVQRLIHASLPLIDERYSIHTRDCYGIANGRVRQPPYFQGINLANRLSKQPGCSHETSLCEVEIFEASLFPVFIDLIQLVRCIDVTVDIRRRKASVGAAPCTDPLGCKYILVELRPKRGQSPATARILLQAR
jgi:hypothetical protein